MLTLYVFPRSRRHEEQQSFADTLVDVRTRWASVFTHLFSPSRALTLLMKDLELRLSSSHTLCTSWSRRQHQKYEDAEGQDQRSRDSLMNSLHTQVFGRAMYRVSKLCWRTSTCSSS